MNPGSPIIIDLEGNGFHFTSPSEGVLFDILSSGERRRVSWYSADAGNAWLVLDWNRNGMLDNSSELFGNHTPQPYSHAPNGFLALAQYDSQEAGGNGDGLISAGDAVWRWLRLWRDDNRDGISQADELLHLDDFGIVAIELDYKSQKWTDQHGNQFKYRAKVRRVPKSRAGHWAFDVFLRSTPQ